MAYKKLKLWFDKDLAILLAQKIRTKEKEFKSDEFVKLIETQVGELELKARIECIADGLYEFLENDYKSNIKLLTKILGPENEEQTGMFTNFYWLMPFAKYCEKYGLNDFDVSMEFISEITKRNTGEYTIRPFLEQETKKTLGTMLKWSNDPNFHVRRLSCEGLRPRLPWATKLQIFIDDPKPTLNILNNLKDDESKYVQNSVANCINDILKDNFEIGKKIIEDWIPNATKERKWIINHAIRNFRKQKNPWATQIVAQL